MKTSIVSKVSNRYLVATVAVLMAVTGVGAVSSGNLAKADKDKVASAEGISVDVTTTTEESSVPDSVTTDDDAVEIQEPIKEPNTSIVTSAVSQIAKNAMFASTNAAAENVKKEVEKTKSEKEPESAIQIIEVVTVYEEVEPTETELVENFGEDEKVEDAETEITDENLTDEEDIITDVTENSEETEESDTSEIKSQPSPYSNHLTQFSGISYFTDENGVTHRESYYDMYMGGVVSIMRNQGFSEEEYPYWVDEIRGTKMLGPYIMIAANLSNHPRGSIVDTDLGKAIVCDTGGFSYTHTEGYDIAVDWSTHWGAYPGYNC